MSGSGVVWAVQDPDAGVGRIIRAGTYRQAVRRAFEETFRGLSCRRRDLEARRLPWLDGYRDLFGPDATMAALRHGWQIDWEDKDGQVLLDGRRAPDRIDQADLARYASRHHLPVEDAYRLVADRIGAAYPDRYKPDGGGIMKNGERTWIVHDWDLDIGTALVRVMLRAYTKQEALGKAYDSVFEPLGCRFEDLEAEQTPWLDGYEHLDDSDAAKEMRLHARQACGMADEHAGGERQGLTMPVDTLADAIDATQCGMAVSEDYIRTLDIASMTMVDMAVSLRALSGRPPVTDTPMQRRMREAIDKGEDPKAAIERCFYGGSFASSYVEAFKRAYKPRSATNPNPSAGSTGNRQEDGKESVSEHGGDES